MYQQPCALNRRCSSTTRIGKIVREIACGKSQQRPNVILSFIAGIPIGYMYKKCWRRQRNSKGKNSKLTGRKLKRFPPEPYSVYVMCTYMIIYSFLMSADARVDNIHV